MIANFYEQAEEMIRHTGDRITSGRVRVLGILLAEKQAISHHEIEERMGDNSTLNRVTLYRILEWLSKKGLAHKVISGDRKWRFRTNIYTGLHQHAHFKCSCCTKVICLSDVKAQYSWPLPPGYQSQEVELTVKGLCAECV
jgi:Fur family transcriptional regulator, ferric uptake regulator